jgi:hypothetical protein
MFSPHSTIHLQLVSPREAFPSVFPAKHLVEILVCVKLATRIYRFLPPCFRKCKHNRLIQSQSLGCVLNAGYNKKEIFASIKSNDFHYISY